MRDTLVVEGTSLEVISRYKLLNLGEEEEETLIFRRVCNQNTASGNARVLGRVGISRYPTAQHGELLGGMIAHGS